MRRNTATCCPKATDIASARRLILAALNQRVLDLIDAEIAAVRALRRTSTQGSQTWKPAASTRARPCSTSCSRTRPMPRPDLFSYLGLVDHVDCNPELFLRIVCGRIRRRRRAARLRRWRNWPWQPRTNVFYDLMHRVGD